MERVGIWNAQTGEIIATIETGDNPYESVLGWLVDEDEREGRYWRVAGVSRWAGMPVPEGFDEMVSVWPVEGGAR